MNRSYLDVLFCDGLMPLLPRKVRGACDLITSIKLPGWFDSDFAVRMNLRDRQLGLTDVFGFCLPSGRDQVAGFLSVMRVVAKASYRARLGIEVSHPYLHRPLVEFIHATPIGRRVRPGETRSLMRRALRDLLPEEILNRKGKKGPDEALFRALARQWPKLQPIFEDARVCSMGYMNAEALQSALARARHGCELYSFALVQTISLEFWLRALERRSFNFQKHAVVEGSSSKPTPVSTSRAAANLYP